MHEVLGSVDVVYKDALYAAPDYRILDTIKSLDDIFESVMFVGELPGVREFVARVAKEPKKCLVRSASGVILTLKKGETLHTIDEQKTLCRPLIKD